MSVALRKASAILVRDARVALAYPVTFWTGWFGLFSQVFTFYFISKLVGPSNAFGPGGRPVPYFDYVALNLAFVRFQNVAIHSYQQAMRGAQMLGTVEAVLATPTSLSLLVLSSGLWAFALTSAQITVFLIVAVFLGLDLSHVNGGAIVLFLVLTVLAMSPIGVLSAASIMSFKQEAPTAVLFGGLASLLGGVLFPVSKLPAALQVVSWLFPITHTLNGLRGAAEGATLLELRGDIVWLGTMTVVLLPISLYVFARSIRRAKMDGTLGDY